MARALKDFTGKRQGELTVIKRASSDPVTWECKCDCGKTVILTHIQLRKGVHNCLDRRVHKKKKSIAIGDKFGTLTVVDITINEKSKHPLYHCVCECGTRVCRTRGGLVNVEFPNCGCQKKEVPISEEMRSMIGKTYGNLIVLDVKRGKDIPELHLPADHRELNKIFAVCKCNVCGNISFPRATAIRTGRIKNCRHTHQANLEKGREIMKKSWVYDTNLFAISGNRSVNKNNTSGYNGVSYLAKNGVWRAYITFRKKQYALGCFKNIEDAVAARKEAEKNIYGNFLEWYTNRGEREMRYEKRCCRYEYRDKGGVGSQVFYDNLPEALKAADTEWSHLDRRDKDSYIKDSAGEFWVGLVYAYEEDGKWIQAEENDFCNPIEIIKDYIENEKDLRNK